MAEWSNAAVLKTVELRGSGGSNPSLSAKEQKNIRSAFRTPLFFIHFERVFLLYNKPPKTLLLVLGYNADFAPKCK